MDSKGYHYYDEHGKNHGEKDNEEAVVIHCNLLLLWKLGPFGPGFSDGNRRTLTTIRDVLENHFLRYLHVRLSSLQLFDVLSVLTTNKGLSCKTHGDLVVAKSHLKPVVVSAEVLSGNARVGNARSLVRVVSTKVSDTATVVLRTELGHLLFLLLCSMRVTRSDRN
jgi:hypothetical protein